ncbi:Deoxyguanosine kinase [Neolewinella maritima]|uniref:Deoxyguanosine kinase n=1 Tax=Neolewinella maritima TaxID=1383882 RepID=A0ABM9B125_9BACT|nr:deoxynucleoside kinase [Neolewinella maritima]CAH1000508.1 Deoxyguanosine kinase [Neolewinella maritima]
MTLPPYTVIEGNIGAGKTTLAERLAAQFGRRLILEEFADNPFLPLFYKDPARYAFPVELFFMAERHKQLEAELAHRELFTQAGTVADYVFIKTLLFARNSLSDQEFRLFNRLFSVMDAGFRDPDLIVYLHRPVAALQANIRRRGRSFEAEITDKYLGSIQTAYFQYFRSVPHLPVVVVDVGDTDFTQPAAYAQLVELLTTKEYAAGMHTITPFAHLQSSL